MIRLAAALFFLCLPAASAQCGWSCNSGDTLSGTTCIDVYAGTVSTQWTCSSGWTGPNGSNRCTKDVCSGVFGLTSPPGAAWACFTSAYLGKAAYVWCADLGRKCYSCSPGGPGGYWCDVNGAGTYNCYKLAGTPVSCSGTLSSTGICSVAATSQTIVNCPLGGSPVSGTTNCRQTYAAIGISCSASSTPSSLPTPSNTPSNSATASKTSSYTRTSSQTASATVSRSFSGSISVSRSESSTETSSMSISLSGTVSATYTPSATVSISHTSTVSRSQSASISFTRTATLSPGLSASMTSSLTATASTTATSSSTKSISLSRTQTRTGSTTPSVSFSGSVSASNTSTPTSSITLGVSISRSQSFTPTYSSTGTGTVSISKSPSGTRTWSPTQTITGTRTASATPSTSFSSSRTETATTTASISETASSSETALSTPSRTATTTPLLPSSTATSSTTVGVSPSQTESASVSFSGSQSGTVTRTVTRTGSRTASTTRTRSASPTYSVSVSETASQSETSTVTASLTESPSESYSGSDTASITGSSTWSPSHTVTASVLPSPSRTNTGSASQTASASVGAPQPNVNPAIINGLGSDDDPQAAGNAPAGGGDGGGGSGGSKGEDGSAGKVAGMEWWLLLIVLLAILLVALCCFLAALLYCRRENREELARRRRALALAAKTGPSTLVKRPQSKLRIDVTSVVGVGRARDDRATARLVSGRPHAGATMSSLFKGTGIEMSSIAPASKSRVDFAPNRSASSARAGEGASHSGTTAGALRSASKKKRINISDVDDDLLNTLSLRSASNRNSSSRFLAGPVHSKRQPRGAGNEGVAAVVADGNDSSRAQNSTGDDLKSGGMQPFNWFKSLATGSSVDSRSGSHMNGARAFQALGSHKSVHASSAYAATAGATRLDSLRNLTKASSQSQVASLFTLIGPSGRADGMGLGGTDSPGVHPILLPSDYRELATMSAEDASNPRYSRRQHRDSVGASLGLEDGGVTALVEEDNDGWASSTVLRALGLRGASSGPASARPSTSALTGSGSVQSQIYSRGSAVSVSSRMRPSLFRVSNPIAAARLSAATTRDLGVSEASTTGTERAAADGSNYPSALSSLPVRRRSDVRDDGPSSANASRTLSGSIRDDAGRLALGVQRPRGYRTASSMNALAQQLGASPSARAMIRTLSTQSSSTSAPAPAPSTANSVSAE